MKIANENEYRPTFIQYNYEKNDTSTMEKVDLEFAFSDQLDNEKMPYEHKAYVKKNCKHCMGRGFVRGVHKTSRYSTTCVCVRKNYFKMKNLYWQLVVESVATGLPIEEARKAALKGLGVEVK